MVKGCLGRCNVKSPMNVSTSLCIVIAALRRLAITLAVGLPPTLATYLLLRTLGRDSFSIQAMRLISLGIGVTVFVLVSSKSKYFSRDLQVVKDPNVLENPSN